MVPPGSFLILFPSISPFSYISSYKPYPSDNSINMPFFYHFSNIFQSRYRVFSPMGRPQRGHIMLVISPGSDIRPQRGRITYLISHSILCIEQTIQKPIPSLCKLVLTIGKSLPYTYGTSQFLNRRGKTFNTHHTFVACSI